MANEQVIINTDDESSREKRLKAYAEALKKKVKKDMNSK